MQPSTSSHDDLPEVLSREEMLGLEGSGWDGDLDAFRADATESPRVPGARFRDPLTRVRSFVDDVLVVCPRCARRAQVLRHGWARHRLLCHHCGLAETAPRNVSTTDLQLARDPHFGAELWLVTECRGRQLWAINLDHLELLEKYVSATLRERGEIPGSMSLVERLPAWIKSAKNREDVLRSIDRLKQRGRHQ